MQELIIEGKNSELKEQQSNLNNKTKLCNMASTRGKNGHDIFKEDEMFELTYRRKKSIRGK